MNMEFTYITVV